jgi:hypothetical protein
MSEESAPSRRAATVRDDGDDGSHDDLHQSPTIGVTLAPADRPSPPDDEPSNQHRGAPIRNQVNSEALA